MTASGPAAVGDVSRAAALAPSTAPLRTRPPTSGRPVADAAAAVGGAEPGPVPKPGASPTAQGRPPSAGGTPAPSLPGPGARTAVVIGNVGTTSGPAGATIGQPTVQAVQIWVRSVNDHGGVNGHPVKLVAADDGADPARHRSLVQQMVERDHVAAFVANPEALSGEGTVPYITGVRVPVIGSEGGNPYFYENPMYFPQMAHSDALHKASLASAAEQLIPEGKKKLATMVCREATACARGDKIYKAFAPQLGFDLVYQAQSSIAQPDFTAECLNAKAAGADVFFILMDINSLGRIAGACARQGYRPTYAYHQNTAVPANAANPALDGAVIAGTAFPWFANDTIAKAEFQSLMARYAPGTQVIGNHAVGWAAAKLFERAAQNLSEPPTPASVLDGLWKIRNDDLGGLTYPLTFNKDEPAPMRICWFDIRIRNGGFIAPNGPRASCRDQ